MEKKKNKIPRIAKLILNSERGITIPLFKFYYKAKVIKKNQKTNMVLAWKRIY